MWVEIFDFGVKDASRYIYIHTYIYMCEKGNLPLTHPHTGSEQFLEKDPVVPLVIVSTIGIGNHFPQNQQ